MKVVKVLNNSLVLALDDEGQQVILAGKGIGFHKATGSALQEEDIEQVFILKDRQLSRSIIRLAADTDAVFFELAKELIDRGRKKYHMNLMDHLYLSLTDHLSYAVARTKDGIDFQNFYGPELKRFSPHEYEMGEYALELVRERCGIALPEDEIGNIAMHFINAEQENPYSSQNQIIRATVKDMLNIIRYTFQIASFDKESTGYARCVTHLRLFVQRVINDQMLPDERDEHLYHEIVDQCRPEWQCVRRIDSYISGRFGKHMTTQEEMFLVLHVHRVLADL